MMPLDDLLGIKKLLYDKQTTIEQLDDVLSSCQPPTSVVPNTILDSNIPNCDMLNKLNDKYLARLRKQRGTDFNLVFIFFCENLWEYSAPIFVMPPLFVVNMMNVSVFAN
jgi:hypothetical protein